MVRKATEQDLESMIDFRCKVSGDTRAQARSWFTGVVGLENVLLVTTEQGPVAMLCAVPVRVASPQGERRGVLLCGMGTLPEFRGRGLMGHLVGGCLQAYAANGCQFVVAVPNSAAVSRLLEREGFLKAFPLRLVRRDIAHRLWANAEFDNLTVRRLMEARRRFQPQCVELPEETMNQVVTELYRRGITMVSGQRGYGLFYQKENTLQFLELQAENDHSADQLLEAARQKTGADRALIMLGENQPLYLGEGKRVAYGMIHFLGKPFDVSDAYLRLYLGE